MNVVKHILRYIKGTLKYGRVYTRGSELQLTCFSDSDHGGDVDDRKSTTGVLFYLGTNPVSWSSQKQKAVAISSCEAEYMAATSGACQGIWLSRLLEQLDQVQMCTTIYCDDSSSIKLSKNPVMHGRCKHTDDRYHFLRDLTKEGVVEHTHCSSGRHHDKSFEA
jgi:hypothetical protein